MTNWQNPARPDRKRLRTWAATNLPVLALSALHPAVLEGYLARRLKLKTTAEDLDEFPVGVWELERYVMRCDS